MNIKTQDLIGPALDWAVAKCKGIDVVVSPLVQRVEFDSYVYAEYCNSYNAGQFHQFNPSVNWSQGGPIIERERLHLIPMVNAPESHHWQCGTIVPDIGDSVYAFGPTPLIAAMRCYVASKLGAEVEVPEDAE